LLRWILLLLRRRWGATLRAGGGLSENGILRQRQNQSSCQNGEQYGRKNSLHEAPLGDSPNLQNGENPAPRKIVPVARRLKLRNAASIPAQAPTPCMLV
jgi:hypothetical protein